MAENLSSYFLWLGRIFAFQMTSIVVPSLEEERIYFSLLNVLHFLVQVKDGSSQRLWWTLFEERSPFISLVETIYEQAVVQRKLVDRRNRTRA